MKVGKILSMNSLFTAKISVEYIETNIKYGKSLKKQKKLTVHNEIEGLKIGDYITYKECPSISKTKKHVIIGLKV